MASPAQVDANRRNAQKSTGPKTEAGKAASRANALKHGLAGEVVAIAVAVADAEARSGMWREEYVVEGVKGEDALGRLVAATIQIERCEEAIEGIFASDPERARLTWDADRRADCAEVFGRLARSPLRTAAALHRSLHGVDLLLETWGRLDEPLVSGDDWTDAEASRALDLLGVPAESRERRTAIDPPRDEDRVAYRREVVAREVERLEGLVPDLAELDLLDRKLAMAGLSTLTSPRAQLVFRYLNEAWRRHEKAVRILEIATKQAKERGEPTPAPTPVVAPRPTPIPPRPIEAGPVATGRPVPRAETKPILHALAALPAVDPRLGAFADPGMPLDFRVGTPRRGS